MPFRQFWEKANAFLRSRCKNAIDRHSIIVYLLHTVIVGIVVGAQLMGLGGSQELLPQVLSLVHLLTCFVAIGFFVSGRWSIPFALSTVALVTQVIFACRILYFVQVRPDNFLHLILLNQMSSLLAVVFLVMCFVPYTPFVVAFFSLAVYGGVAVYLREPALWSIFGFFAGVELLFCVLGELLLRNVRHMQTENTMLHHRETALMRAVRLNEREIEGYLRMSSNDRPTAADTDRMFAMLTPKSQRNLINAVRLHLKSHLLDDCDLARLFPTLTKSEVEVCNLILQGKKLGEICRLLEKTEKNIGVVRTHVRRKLHVPPDEDLRKFLMEQLLAKKQARP